MITDNFVSTILQASITGAGLILAVYGLVIPIFSKILNYRIESLKKRIRDLKSKPAKDFLLGKNSIEEMRNDLTYIESMRNLPSYFSWMVIASFLLYVLGALFSTSWFLNYEKNFMEVWIPRTFVIASILFAIVGGMTIKDLIGLIKDKHEKLLKDTAEELDEEKNIQKKK